MKVKVFQSNHNGKIEFTRAELEKLLNEVYTDGYNEGKSSQNWTWTSPYLTYTGDTITGTSTTAVTNLKSDNGSNIDKLTCSCDSATEALAVPSTYTVSVNGSNTADIGKAIADIVTNARNSIYNIQSPKQDDAFTRLAKELNF